MEVVKLPFLENVCRKMIIKNGSDIPLKALYIFLQHAIFIETGF